MINTYAIVALGVIYVVSTALVSYWQQKSVPPDSVLSRYPLSTRGLALLPFISQQRAGIMNEHITQFGEHRRRTWIFLVVFIGTPQLGYLYLWLRYA